MLVNLVNDRLPQEQIPMTATRSDSDADYSLLLRQHVADEVRVTLTRHRMSGAELARRMGRSQTFMARRLDGRQAMDMDDLGTIGAILGVSPDSFLPSAEQWAAFRRGMPDRSTMFAASGFDEFRQMTRTAADDLRKMTTPTNGSGPYTDRYSGGDPGGISDNPQVADVIRLPQPSSLRVPTAA